MEGFPFHSITGQSFPKQISASLQSLSPTHASRLIGNILVQPNGDFTWGDLN